MSLLKVLSVTLSNSLGTDVFFYNVCGKFAEDICL